MKLKVKLLKPFKDSVGKDELEVDSGSSNAEQLLLELCAKYPRLKSQIMDSKGMVDYSVNVILNGVPLTNLAQKIKENDEVTLFIPVGGG